MSKEEVKLPNPNAVKELRERYNIRKQERMKKFKEFAKILKKKGTTKEDC